MNQALRRTKIVVTLGPATDHNEQLKKIIIAGANLVRINFSHSNYDEHQQRVERVRRIAKELDTYVAIIADLQGPKIRISSFAHKNIELIPSKTFIIDTQLAEKQGNETAVGTDYQALAHDVKPNDILLLDDGKIRLQVTQIKQSKVITKVLCGGMLSDHKGLNKLGGGLSAQALTEKDKQDIIYAANMQVDYLAVSFPRNADDINYARQLMQSAGSSAKIIAKIERAEAVASLEKIDDIIMAADGVMVARGDLGVEIGDAELIGMQKTIIQRARIFNRAVITATQMMESMITNPTPTRAEVMDVANAVLDGTDAVMLSAETSIGQYPVETVTAMANVCLGAEKMPRLATTLLSSVLSRLEQRFTSVEEATALFAMSAANHLEGVTAIIAMTESGRTALMMSRISSGLPIFAISRHKSTLNLTTLYRGVTPVYLNINGGEHPSTIDAINLLKLKGLIRCGDLVIITQGDNMGKIGSTNTIKTIKVN